MRQTLLELIGMASRVVEGHRPIRSDITHGKAGITIDCLETAFEDIIAPVIETATAISALKSARKLRSAADCFSTRFF